MAELTVICSILSLIVSFFALALGAYSAIIVVGLRNSTHRIEWMPVDKPFENKEEDLEEFSEDPLDKI